ncbi:MAG: membrane protein insertion efficiency factor YidD [Halobacteriovoraceae bacterium]|nr:membrane protein insertion efficiency factor YidD [Halobacteriovoraceae bacterium]
MKRLFIFIIRAYQVCISPVLGANCRFIPTCSCYSHECFQKFSFFKAIWYSLFRILKCHPFHRGGVDPVPLD